MNPKSPLYDYDFDHSPDRYNLSNKILSIITHENRKSVGRTEVIKSTKGYHIVLRFTEEMLPMLNCKKLKLTDYICNKYGITEDERKRADIDLLLMHQVKKYGYPIKPRMLWRKRRRKKSQPILIYLLLNLHRKLNLYGPAVISHITQFHSHLHDI